MGDVETLTKTLYKLPAEARREVEDFAEFLLSRHEPRPSRKPRLDWKGALRDLKDQHTSVALQHGALEWWVG